MRLTNLSIAFLFAISPLISHANESCSISIDSSGDLICRRGLKTDVLSKNFLVNETMEASSTFNRDEKQYLFDESYAADKNMIVIPVIHIEGEPHYERILTFALDRFNEDPRITQLYYGSEYKLNKPRPISGFTWDRIRSDIGVAYENSKPTRRKASIANTVVPNGYDVTPVTLYGPDGSDQGTRKYKDLSENGFTPSSTVCMSNCWLSNGHVEAL